MFACQKAKLHSLKLVTERRGCFSHGSYIRMDEDAFHCPTQLHLLLVLLHHVLQTSRIPQVHLHASRSAHRSGAWYPLRGYPRQPCGWRAQDAGAPSAPAFRPGAVHCRAYILSPLGCSWRLMVNPINSKRMDSSYMNHALSAATLRRSGLAPS